MKTVEFKTLRKKLGYFIETHTKRGNNTVDVIFEKGRVVYHHDTLVCAMVYNPKLEKWEYLFTPQHAHSQTTNKVVLSFCNLTKVERERGIENGEFAMITNIHMV